MFNLPIAPLFPERLWLVTRIILLESKIKSRIKSDYQTWNLPPHNGQLYASLSSPRLKASRHFPGRLETNHFNCAHGGGMVGGMSGDALAGFPDLYGVVKKQAPQALGRFRAARMACSGLLPLSQSFEPSAKLPQIPTINSYRAEAR